VRWSRAPTGAHGPAVACRAHVARVALVAAAATATAAAAARACVAPTATAAITSSTPPSAASAPTPRAASTTDVAAAANADWITHKVCESFSKGVASFRGGCARAPGALRVGFMVGRSRVSVRA